MKKRRELGLLTQLIEKIVEDTADIFILFVDLCGSTEYKRHCIATKQPDLNWIFRQLYFLKRAAEIIEKHDGTVVKTIGDEVLAMFAASVEAEAVLKCAIEIIQRFENLKVYAGDSKIEVKASIDSGPTYNGSIVSGLDFDPIGLPVDRCARLNQLARKNQITLSKDFFSAACANSSPKEFMTRYGCESHLAELKGIGRKKYFSITLG
jgi:class 3 adenylate cyclase